MDSGQTANCQLKFDAVHPIRPYDSTYYISEIFHFFIFVKIGQLENSDDAILSDCRIVLSTLNRMNCSAKQARTTKKLHLALNCFAFEFSLQFFLSLSAIMFDVRVLVNEHRSH